MRDDIGHHCRLVTRGSTTMSLVVWYRECDRHDAEDGMVVCDVGADEEDTSAFSCLQGPGGPSEPKESCSRRRLSHAKGGVTV